jgi:hypothetical protein
MLELHRGVQHGNGYDDLHGRDRRRKRAADRISALMIRRLVDRRAQGRRVDGGAQATVAPNAFYG